MQFGLGNDRIRVHTQVAVVRRAVLFIGLSLNNAIFDFREELHKSAPMGSRAHGTGRRTAPRTRLLPACLIYSESFLLDCMLHLSSTRR